MILVVYVTKDSKVDLGPLIAWLYKGKFCPNRLEGNQGEGGGGLLLQIPYAYMFTYLRFYGVVILKKCQLPSTNPILCVGVSKILEKEHNLIS